MDLLLAFSLQDQVEKYGAYVGLAAFLGLAVLTVLYFAQARELKRLRDWAGRAPERAQEIEARVVAQAEEALRAPRPSRRPSAPAPSVRRSRSPSRRRRRAATAARPERPRRSRSARARRRGGRRRGRAPPRRAAAPQPLRRGAPAAEAAGDDGARRRESSRRRPPAREAVAAVAAAAPERPEQADAGRPSLRPEPEAEPEPEPEPAPEARSRPATASPAEPAIPRATPRPQPRPTPAPTPAPARRRSGAALLHDAARPRRRAGAPSAPGLLDDGAHHRDHRSVGIVVLAAVVAFGATQISRRRRPQPARPTRPSSPAARPATARRRRRRPSAAARPDTVVAILNGTPTDGLAGALRDKLVAEGYSDRAGMIRTGNNTTSSARTRWSCTRSGKRRQARDVAQILDISAHRADRRRHPGAGRQHGDGTAERRDRHRPTSPSSPARDQSP